jgi:hypothetical protein
MKKLFLILIIALICIGISSCSESKTSQREPATISLNNVDGKDLSVTSEYTEEIRALYEAYKKYELKDDQNTTPGYKQIRKVKSITILAKKDDIFLGQVAFDRKFTGDDEVETYEYFYRRQFQYKNGEYEVISYDYNTEVDITTYESLDESIYETLDKIDSNNATIYVSDGLEKEKNKVYLTPLDKKIQITYDYGKTWTDVPLSLKDISEIGNGNRDEDKLLKGCYYISSEKTVFAFGGYRSTKEQHTPASVLVSEDQGAHWKTYQVDDSFELTHHFIDFVSKDIGYLVLSGNRWKSGESFETFETRNGGKTWTKKSTDQPTDDPKGTGWISSACFPKENLGIVTTKTYLNLDSDAFITKDGGVTYKRLNLPDISEEHKKWFIYGDKDVTTEDNNIIIWEHQGETDTLPDVKIKFVSSDCGETWTLDGFYDKLDLKVEPHLDEQAGYYIAK